MKIGIIGASGFVGKNLISFLIQNTQNEIFAFSKSGFDHFQNDRVINFKLDILDPKNFPDILSDLEVVVYLVHMMDTEKGDYDSLEDMGALNTALYLEKSKKLKRIIYLSGLGDSKTDLSKHLKSRQNTGEIFRKYLQNVIEFRASIIVGDGSTSFEVVKNVISKIPILLLPKTIKTKVQPILINDVLFYLSGAIHKEILGKYIIEIGGPKVFTYFDFLKFCAQKMNYKRFFIIMPFVFLNFYKYILYFFVPKRYAIIASNMLDSFRNEMIVTNNIYLEIFPEIMPQGVEMYFNK